MVLEQFLAVVVLEIGVDDYIRTIPIKFKGELIQDCW